MGQYIINFFIFKILKFYFKLMYYLPSVTEKNCVTLLGKIREASFRNSNLKKQIWRARRALRSLRKRWWNVKNINGVSKNINGVSENVNGVSENVDGVSKTLMESQKRFVIKTYKENLFSQKVKVCWQSAKIKLCVKAKISRKWIFIILQYFHLTFVWKV